MKIIFENVMKLIKHSNWEKIVILRWAFLVQVFFFYFFFNEILVLQSLFSKGEVLSYFLILNLLKKKCLGLKGNIFIFIIGSIGIIGIIFNFIVSELISSLLDYIHSYYTWLIGVFSVIVLFGYLILKYYFFFLI